MNDKYKIKLSTFTAELDEPLDREKRTLITVECDIYSVDVPSNNDGSFDTVYRAKVNGSTILKQGESKPILCKSKRSASKKLRGRLWGINPSEEFYQATMNKLIARADEVVEFLQ